MRLGRALLPACAAASLLSAACKVEFGGASFALENPAPPPAPTPEAPAEDTAAAPIPLPEGPLLYVARFATAGDRALVLPIVRVTTDGIADLELPGALPADFRARFDSAFLRPGAELALHAGGERIGSLVLAERRIILGDGCPSAAEAHVLVPPGGRAPSFGLAVPLDVAAAPPVRFAPSEPDRRMLRYAPILAERLLREAGERRPFLARRVRLATVRFQRDEAPGIAATYLIGDTLAPVAPAGEAVSLFYLARFEPARGYVPAWSIVRRYTSPAEKEAYAFLDWVALPSGRIDFLTLFNGAARRLAASAASVGERRIDWREPAGCPSPQLMKGALGG
ncbi:MAG: hypothetical protein ACE5JR_02770 [Gemmatimonadota bacterium]